MGSSSSLPKGITEELLEDYVELTYLNRGEILVILKQFMLMTPDEKCMDLSHRYPMDLVVETFPQLKYNPFKDRIFKVFSSLGDDQFSFEDMLDLCSVMSENCPEEVKARWAFQIFDLNENGMVDAEDIKLVIDRLTHGNDENREISLEDKEYIVDVLLHAMDIQRNGSLNPLEFEHALGKMPEFRSSFTFRI